MQILAQLALFVLCLLMFKVDRKHKLAILLLCAVCFMDVVLPFVPLGGGQYILCICFALSEIRYVKRHWRIVKPTILKSLLISVVVGTIIALINSPHYNNSLYLALRLLMTDLVCKYFVICYAFLSIRGERDLKPIFTVLYYSTLVLSTFAVLNFITKYSIFINSLQIETWAGNGNAGELYRFSDRFRVQAMFFNPFNYGYTCMMLLLLGWYGYVTKQINRIRFFVITVCCVFGVFVCGSRTVVLCSLIGCFTFILLTFNLTQKVRLILMGGICLVLLIGFVPYFSGKISEVFSIFDENSDVGGSSIEMRIGQYAAVLYYLRDHILFGRGVDFFLLDMGWGMGNRFLVDRDLAGLEGVLMGYLLERGLVGTLIYLFFYGSLMFFIIRKRRCDKKAAALGLSVLISYLAFANMTGELKSSFLTLLILGICVRLLIYNQGAVGKLTPKM